MLFTTVWSLEFTIIRGYYLGVLRIDTHYKMADRKKQQKTDSTKTHISNFLAVVTAPIRLEACLEYFTKVVNQTPSMS